MKKLILAAAASALAVAAPLLAHQHMDHAEHGEDHIRDTATFMKMHGEAVSGAINHPTRAEDAVRDVHRHPAEVLAFFHVART